MKKDLENTFREIQEDFDFAEPDMGHFDRFEAKLKGEKKTKKNNRTSWLWLSVAAMVFLAFGFMLGNLNQKKGLELADVSSQMEETQNFYLASIQKEIEVVKLQQTPENQKIIEDSFIQLEILEQKYEQLTFELKESNEDKRVIFAMISNFQTRIQVLKNLLDQLEKFEKTEDNLQNISYQINKKVSNLNI